MRRGTNPTLKLVTDQDWTGYEIIVTLEEVRQGVQLDIKGDRLTISGNTVYVTLTQEETLKFQSRVEVQIKGKKGNTVIATDIMKIKVLPILNEEVM